MKHHKEFSPALRCGVAFWCFTFNDNFFYAHFLFPAVHIWADTQIVDEKRKKKFLIQEKYECHVELKPFKLLQRL